MFTLQGRLALVNVTVLLIALVLLAAIVLNQVAHDLAEQLDTDLQAVSQQESARIRLLAGAPLFTAESHHSNPKLGPVGFVRLLDRQGHITGGLGHYDSLPILPESLLVPPQGQGFNQTTPDGLLLRLYSQPLLVNNIVVGYIQTADDQEEIQETSERVRRSLLVGIPLALLVAGLLSLIAARQALRPLSKMTRSAATINAEDLNKRLPVPRAKDEVQALALAFNATLDRLAAAFARQRRFTADASHELRTPVTAILGQAEIALSRSRSPEAYQHSLTRILSEAERMQRLIGRMLSLARLETGRQPITLAPTNIAGLIQTLVETLEPRASAKNLAFEVDVPPTLILWTDTDSLTQILLNLLENAITYTDQGQVVLSLTANADTACLKISDTGQGILPEHLPYIFHPFYRVDPARRQDEGRVGLGLALTYELVHLLGGTIEVASQPGVGTTFSLTLPVQKSG
jgi:heavy metal sensor kinase